MKFTWGWGIALFLMGFMAYILSMVFQAQKVQTDLYAEDYYAQEVNFQQTLNAKARAVVYKDSIRVEQNETGIKISFPQALAGKENTKVNLYRANNAQLDLNFKAPQNNFIWIASEDLIKGNYQLKVQWEAENEEYLVEKNIYY
ncbi:FixH protein [Lishizhenia tianjinensis]|uniref:FixH protein n=1 Tax=Lishizhenia tianjinensis TaxID=477690 RepID=A0A1I7B961_9FLAO|nr:FixH family protein [Lishizhenia tianjinensis]SFT83707.1 FixH protein [Lishizhenia tianjinensis]